MTPPKQSVAQLGRPATSGSQSVPTGLQTVITVRDRIVEFSVLGRRDGALGGVIGLGNFGHGDGAQIPSTLVDVDVPRGHRFLDRGNLS